MGMISQLSMLVKNDTKLTVRFMTGAFGWTTSTADNFVCDQSVDQQG